MTCYVFRKAFNHRLNGRPICGEVNVLFSYLSISLKKRPWRFGWKPWKHDGLQRYDLELGPLFIHWGTDHYWRDAEYGDYLF